MEGWSVEKGSYVVSQDAIKGRWLVQEAGPSERLVNGVP